MCAVTTPTRDEVRRAPKVLLHDHLDGGLRPQTIIDLAADCGHELPADDADAAGPLVRRVGRLGLAGALPRDLRPHRRGHADRPGHHAGRPRVRRGPGRRRRRLRRGPLRPRAARRERADPRRGGRRRCRRASTRPWPPRGGRIVVRQLLTAMRHQARSMEIAELAVAWRDRGVAGFDIAGAEAGFPPTRHLDAFEYLQRENAHFTIHAGEAFGAAVDLAGDPVVRRRPARPRRADHRRHHRPRRRHGRARPPRGLRPRQADPAGDVPGAPTSRPAPPSRSPSTRSGCSPGSGSGSRSTPTTG